jgi:hypothetical protein
MSGAARLCRRRQHALKRRARRIVGSLAGRAQRERRERDQRADQQPE